MAADEADEHGEPAAATYLRETANAWNASIEGWLYVTDTELARRQDVAGYNVRTDAPDSGLVSTPISGRLILDGEPSVHRGVPITEIVSPVALALVCFGLRAPDDPRVLDTIRVIDATLKVETPYGPKLADRSATARPSTAPREPRGDAWSGRSGRT